MALVMLVMLEVVSIVPAGGCCGASGLLFDAAWACSSLKRFRGVLCRDEVIPRWCAQTTMAVLTGAVAAGAGAGAGFGGAFSAGLSL